MDRQALRDTLLDLLEQETWDRPEEFNDAVDLLSVTLQAERKLGISVDSRDFGALQTVGDLLDLLQAKLAAKSATAPASKAA